jgi:DNA-directed RNA polymerase subunit RPC12/RpoP
MTLYKYICELCGLQVIVEEQEADINKTKACACPCGVIEEEIINDGV